jgi:hypothetical protein
MSRLTVTIMTAMQTTADSMSGRSRRSIAWISRMPIPGQPKTVSMTTAPFNITAASSPIRVRIGSAAFRSVWRMTTTRSASPLARAVVTYPFDISSSIALRTTWLMRPIGRTASASAGRMTYDGPPKPEVGNQPSSTAKTMISISPSQKSAVETPASAMTVTARSANERGRTAEMMPSRSAVGIANRSVTPAR